MSNISRFWLLFIILLAVQADYLILSPLIKMLLSYKVFFSQIFMILLLFFIDILAKPKRCHLIYLQPVKVAVITVHKPLTTSRAQPGTRQTSKMESFTKIVNGFWSLTVFVRLSVKDLHLCVSGGKKCQFFGKLSKLTK